MARRRHSRSIALEKPSTSPRPANTHPWRNSKSVPSNLNGLELEDIQPFYIWTREKITMAQPQSGQDAEILRLPEHQLLYAVLWRGILDATHINCENLWNRTWSWFLSDKFTPMAFLWILQQLDLLDSREEILKFVKVYRGKIDHNPRSGLVPSLKDL